MLSRRALLRNRDGHKGPFARLKDELPGEHRRACRPAPVQIVANCIEQTLRGEGLLQSLIRDWLRGARARKCQRRAPSLCGAANDAGHSRRAKSLDESRRARPHLGSILPVLVQIPQEGFEKFLGCLHQIKALVRDRLGNSSGEKLGRQQRIRFSSIGPCYPITKTARSDDSSPYFGIPVGLRIDRKHALQQSLKLVPVWSPWVTKERQQACDEGLFLGVLRRQFTRQLAGTAGSLLHSRKPSFSGCRVLGMQPINQAFQDYLLKRGVNLRDLLAERQMQVLGNSDHDVLYFWLTHLHATVKLNMLTP